MASRDTEFTAFVDARGPALIRSASLLELDDAVAHDAVVAALGKAARQWRALSRDGTAEVEVRRHLHEDLISRWRRADTGDAVPPEAPLGEDASAARQALATLTNRQRALVALSGFDGLPSTEIADLLRTSTSDVQQDTEDAAARFRRAGGVAADAPLLALLNAAASRGVPPDLADRALEASRSGNRRLLVGAGVGAVAVVALAAVVVTVLPERDGGTASPDPVAANVERWGIPDEVPLPRGLPSLTEQPVESASMAYVAGGVPVVTDAATGAARTVLAGGPQPEWYDGNVDGVVTGLLRRGPPWTQAVLSPDGEWLLLVQATGSAERDDTTGDMYLVRVDTGVVTPVPNAMPMARPQGEASVADSVLAWAPGGGAFACVCSGKLSVFDLEPTAPRVVETSASSTRATDAVWGAEGLVVRQPNGEWLSVSAPSTSIRQVGSPDALAISATPPTVYLGVSVRSIYALGADTSPDGGSCVWWDEDFSTPVPVTPVPDRDGALCTPVALQPGLSGVLLVIRPDRPRPQPLPLDVVTVDTFGASTVIGALPPGTTFASFAARLVG